jgi:2-keto-4-pentenoate hydratase/2-oxohepta-3-ene-1,7-dioic acid hydratase in catechol pathway
MPAPAVIRIVRYLVDGVPRIGRLDGDALRRMSAPPWEGGAETGEHDVLGSVRLLPPVVPTKIVCVGLNYRAHIAESATVLPDAETPREPLIFFKPPSAVVAHGQAIVYPPSVTRLDPEGELAVVIGRRARHVRAGTALDHVAGLTCFDDVSARNHQRADGQWTRAKGFDTFAPLGPWVALGLDPAALEVECRVNGVRRQHGRTADLLFAVPALVSFISSIMTLEPGDVIATGTPAGVAPVVPGDLVEVEIPGIGTLANRVEAAPDVARG